LYGQADTRRGDDLEERMAKPIIALQDALEE